MTDTIGNDSFSSTGIQTDFFTPVITNQPISVNGGLNLFSDSTYNDNNLSDIGNISMRNLACSNSLLVSSPTPTLLDPNCSAAFVLGPVGTFKINKVNGGLVDPVLSINDLTKINMHIPLDMNNSNLLNVLLAQIQNINCSSLTVSEINGLTPTGGVYMMTGEADAISGTTAETSILIGSTGVGSLLVPANEFVISSYHFNLSGNVSTVNGDTLTIRLNNGVSLASFVVDLNPSQNEFFELEADFSIMKRGGPGEAEITTNFDFTYSDAGSTAWRGKRICVTNNTTFDTTIDNTLSITVQWDTTDNNNSIQCRQAILTKTY